jgi:hypothetical protein
MEDQAENIADRKIKHQDIQMKSKLKELQQANVTT